MVAHARSPRSPRSHYLHIVNVELHLTIFPNVNLDGGHYEDWLSAMRSVLGAAAEFANMREYTTLKWTNAAAAAGRKV